REVGGDQSDFALQAEYPGRMASRHVVEPGFATVGLIGVDENRLEDLATLIFLHDSRVALNIRGKRDLVLVFEVPGPGTGSKAKTLTSMPLVRGSCNKA